MTPFATYLLILCVEEKQGRPNSNFKLQASRGLGPTLCRASLLFVKASNYNSSKFKALANLRQARREEKVLDGTGRKQT